MNDLERESFLHKGFKNILSSYMYRYFSIVSMIRCSLLFVHISRSADKPEIPIGPRDDQIQTVLQDGFLQTT